MESTISSNLKFARGGEKDESFRYPHVYQVESREDQRRLVVGPAGRHCQLAAQLAACLPEPLKLLYVLVVPGNNDSDGARYESPVLSRAEVEAFLQDHERFLQSDGRHHLWLSNPRTGTVVYDRHEILYAYGPIEEYLKVLHAWGVVAGEIMIPAPHWHLYHREFDAEEAAVVGRWRWLKKPLRDQDEA